MDNQVFEDLMQKNNIRFKNKKKEHSKFRLIPETVGMGMRRGFYGFFGGLPFSPFDPSLNPLGWQKVFNRSIVETTPSGAVRIDPGVPLYSGDYYGTSYWPNQPFKPPYQSFDYLRHQMYDTAWKLGRVKNITPEMKDRFLGDLQFTLNSLKKMYPFDYTNNFNKISQSINNAFKANSGSNLQSNLMDSIYVLDFLKSKVGYLPFSPFKR